MKKATNLPRYKSGLGNRWKYVTSPGPYYWGGGLHYVNKQGRFVHAKPSEMKIDKSNDYIEKVRSINMNHPPFKPNPSPWGPQTIHPFNPNEIHD